MLTMLAGAVLLTVLVLLPGYAVVVVARARNEPPLDPLELVGRSAAVGVLLTGWLALVLVEIGWLRLPLVALPLGLLTGGLALAARRRGRPWRVPTRRPDAAGWALAVTALLVLILAARPHEMVLGGTDAGVYTNTGVTIARTGRLLITDPITADLATTAPRARVATDSQEVVPSEAEGAVRHLMLRLPEGRFPFADYLRLAGFYVLDMPSGTLTPQFLHLYPTWLGLFGQAMGDAGLLHATPILGWLGALMLALAARRLYGGWVGVATLLVLGLNSLQIWFSRHSLSEALLQFLLCTAVHGWVLAHPPAATADRPTAVNGAGLALAGVAMGSVALAHAQFVFAFGLLPPLAAWLWLSGRWRRVYWAFFGPVLALLAHASLHIGLFALGYFEGLYHHVILDLWRARALVAATLAAVVALLLLLRWSRRLWWPVVTHPTVRSAAPVALAASLALIFGFAYLVRPGILPASLGEPALLASYIGAPVEPGPAANLVRLGWYLSPLGMLLAGIGLTGLAYRFTQRLLLLALLAGVYGLAFNLASFTHESYIYSLRRFVPIVLPALSLAIAYAAVVMLPGLVAIRRASPVRRWLGRAAGAGGLALLTLFFAVTGRTIITHVENEGAGAQVAAIAALFAPTDIILFSGPRDEPHKLATPLRFVHGLDTLVVSTNNPRGDLIDAWLRAQMQAGRRPRVVLGNNGGKLLLPSFRLEPVASITLTLRELERLTDQKPFNIQINRLDYTLYDLHPMAGAPLAGPPYRYQTGPGDELATVVGWHAREVDPDGVAFRWTGGGALLRLPWPAQRGDSRLRLALSGGVRPSHLGPARVDLLLARGQNDRQAAPLAHLTLTESFTVHEIHLPATLLPDQPDATVMLEFRVRPWQPSETGLSPDTRSLGIRLAWLEMLPDR